MFVSPKKVTVLAPVNDNELTFQSPAGQSAQPVAQTSAQGSSTFSFVTSEQFLAMSDKWAEQFARMEALLSTGNIFSTPKNSVKQITSQDLISDTPFLAPSAWSTGPMETPAVPDGQSKLNKEENKDKKKGHNSCKDKDIIYYKKRDRTDSPVHCKATTGTQAHALSPPARSHSGPELDQQPGAKAKIIPENTSVTQDSSMAPRPIPGPSGTVQVASVHASRGLNL